MIKKILYFACIVYGTTIPLRALAVEQNYAAFSVKALLTQTGSLSVNEQFIFDYGITEKHGIIRTIPLILTEGGRTFLFDAISVTDKNSSPYKYEISKGGNIATIKIGNPALVLTGTHYYDVKYTLNHVGSASEATWKIVTPMKENIERFQADFYLPVPVPVQTSTSTCGFDPDSGRCVVIPLSKSGLVAGYRISANNLKGQGITLTVKYPFGLVTEVKQTGYSKKFVAGALVVLFGFGWGVFLLYKRKNKIKKMVIRLLSKKKDAEEYSYLSRAVAYRNEITERDVLATLCDLEERGYILLTPTSETETEYKIERTAEDLPPGPEALLISTLGEDPVLLSHWYTELYPKIKDEILHAAETEVQGVVLTGESHSMPSLRNFKFPI